MRALQKLGLVLSSVWLGLGAWTAGADVDREPSVNLPRDVSVDGHHLDHELWLITILITVIFLLCFGWMLYAMGKHRAGRAAKYDHGNTRGALFLVVGMAMAIFVLLDAPGFVNAVGYLNEHFWNQEYHDREAHPEATRIQVNARQWAWQIRYEGRDGKFTTADDIVELNTVRIPVDSPVAVQLTASDVIHAFSLPNLRIKADAVPGHVAKFWFQIDPERLAASGSTEFDLVCQQHCGTHHYKMKGTLVVMSREDYDRWYEEASIQAELDYDPGPEAAAVAQAKEKLEAAKQKAAEAGEEAPYDALAEWQEKYGAHWGWDWELANASKS